MQVKPLSNRLVVVALSAEQATKAGIIIPDTIEKEKPEKGEVVATGPGKLLDNGQLAPMTVKVGDKVMFKKYSPDEFKLDGKTYLILEETDVLATLS